MRLVALLRPVIATSVSVLQLEKSLCIYLFVLFQVFGIGSGEAGDEGVGGSLW